MPALPWLQIGFAASYVYLTFAPALLEMFAPQPWAAAIPEQVFVVLYPLGFAILIVLGTATARSRRRMQHGRWKALAVAGNLVAATMLAVSVSVVAVSVLIAYLVSQTDF